MAAKAGLFVFIQRLWQFDVYGEPGRLQFSSQAASPTHQRRRSWTRADSDEQPLARLPGVGNALRLPVSQHVLTNVLGGKTKREFPKSGQISRAKKMLLRGSCGFRNVNLARSQAR